MLFGKNKKKLFLHIGTHKTGTTTLQHYLDYNRETLKTIGWLYPKAGIAEGEPHVYGHRDVAWGLDGRPVAYGHSSLEREIKAFRAAGFCILSSEEFEYSRNIQAISDALVKQFSEIEIIVYFRRQDDLLLSNYNQSLKSGRYLTMPLQAFAKMMENEGRFDYGGLCQRWAAVFGADQIMARVYDPSRSIIEDFCTLVGIPDGVLVSPPTSFPNQSLDPRLTGALKIINLLRKDGISEPVFAELQSLILEFEARLPGDRCFALMSRASRKEFLSCFEKTNQQLAEFLPKDQRFSDPTLSNAGEITVDESQIPPFLAYELLRHLSISPHPAPGESMSGNS